MKPLLSQLGSRLRALRLRHFRSQEAFARKCRALGIPITREKMANWELGRAEVPSALVPFLTSVMKVSVTELLPDLTRYGLDQLIRAREFRDTPIRKAATNTPFAQPGRVRAANGGNTENHALSPQTSTSVLPSN